MRNRVVVSSALAQWLLLLAVLAGGCQTEQAPSREDAGPATTVALVEEPSVEDITVRTVSLRILQDRLQACSPVCPEDLLQFGGLKNVLGYVIDRKNKDILVFGETDLDRPPLYVEDFVVALRHTWGTYRSQQGLDYPGCSIDPNPQTMQRLNGIQRQLMGSSSSRGVQTAIDNWRQTCREPQKVRVLGIPFDTRFAHVMVEADYDMKTLADGSDSLGIPGFTSLSHRVLAQAREAIIQNRPLRMSALMNRFWFYPGPNRYEEDDDIVWIKQSPVELRTEEMVLSGGNLRSGAGADPLAGAFAENLSHLYEKVAAERPIYAELENLFRFVALAQIIKFKSATRKAQLDLNYLLESFPISPVSVARTVPGRSTVHTFTHRQQVPGGVQIAQLWMPSCGGVTMALEVTQRLFEPYLHLGHVGAELLLSRTSSSALYGTLAGKPNRNVANLLIRDKIHQFSRYNPNRSLFWVEDRSTAKQVRFVIHGMKDVYDSALYPDYNEFVETIHRNERLKNDILFIPRGFAASNKTQDFLSDFQIHLNRINPRKRAWVLPEGSEEALLQPGFQIEQGSITVQPKTTGQFKNMVGVTFAAFVYVGQAIKRVVITVYVTSQELARALRVFLMEMVAPSPETLMNFLNNVKLKAVELGADPDEVMGETEGVRITALLQPSTVRVA